jgi:hypothetical protein
MTTAHDAGRPARLRAARRHPIAGAEVGPPEARWPLPSGQVRRLAAARVGHWLQARGGRLWLTRSGGGAAPEADVWLQDGQAHWLPPGSEWVIEGWGSDAGFWLLQAPAPGPCVA